MDHIAKSFTVADPKSSEGICGLIPSLHSNYFLTKLNETSTALNRGEIVLTIIMRPLNGGRSSEALLLFQRVEYQEVHKIRFAGEEW